MTVGKVFLYDLASLDVAVPRRLADRPRPAAAVRRVRLAAGAPERGESELTRPTVGVLTQPPHDPRPATSDDEELLEAETTAILSEFTDAQRLLRIQDELRAGFRALSHVGKAVSIFGSARTPRDHPRYAAARRLARQLGEEGYAIVTGGGPGIMEAANRGAREAGRRLGRPRHRAAARAVAERVRRRRRDLPLLLHPQGHVRPLRERVRGLPRRVRDARRGSSRRRRCARRRRSATSRSCCSTRSTGAGWSRWLDDTVRRDGNIVDATSPRWWSRTRSPTCGPSSTRSSTGARVDAARAA